MYQYEAAWPHSTVPSLTASSTPGVGTISPAANREIWNLPPVAAATRLATVSVAPKMASSVLGKPEAQRHLMVGRSAARAGAAAAPAAMPALACFRKERRSMMCPLLLEGKVVAARL